MKVDDARFEDVSKFMSIYLMFMYIGKRRGKMRKEGMLCLSICILCKP